MAKIVYDEDTTNDDLVFVWYKCNTEDEIRSIFRSINIEE